MKVGTHYSHLIEKGIAENVILKQAEMLTHKGHETLSYFAYIDTKALLDAIRIRNFPNQP